MADFDDGYFTPMDQEYHEQFEKVTKGEDIEQNPIFPMHMVGITVPENDPTGRNRNIVEGVDAAFKGGAGNIQLVMQVPGQISAIGGGPKAYGEEVRQAIREIQKAAGAKITGVELPTQINNLSGFAQQQFSEEQRRLALEEVKDSIKFIGDIAGGGTVDVVSFESPRNISDADWEGHEQFEQKGEEFARLVDSQTGQIQTIDKRQKFFLPIDKKTGVAYTNDDFKEGGKGEFNPFTWKDMEKWAKKEGESRTAEQIFLDETHKQKIRSVAGQEASVNAHLAESEGGLKRIKENRAELEKFKQDLSQASSPGEKQRLLVRKNLSSEDEFNKSYGEQVEELDRHKGYYENVIDSSNEQLQQIKSTRQEYEEEKNKLKPITEFAKGKTTDSYSEAGVWAMQESQKNQYVQRDKGTISVGPEIGWPQFYGSHPTEWVGTILKSREKMVKRLTQEKMKDPSGELNEKGKVKMVENPYYDSSISQSEAQNLAKEHIKGELDTSHLGMWLQNFKQELPWDQRITEFKKWYKEQIVYLADQNKKHDIIGGIQMVDSASGAHGHVAPGQGILGKDMFDYMKILKEQGGYNKEITSEGHEEEKFNQGRILTKAWETLQSPVATGYWHGTAAPRFSDIATSYAQIAYGTTGIFRSYVPSNDFTLWSEVPFE